MAGAEDNFRVEVWDIDETQLVETVSRSPDFLVSIAAWQAAIRRRPGMLLIHRNAGHVMERMRAPGEKVAEPQTIVAGTVHAALDVALRDLRDWHRIKARCDACGHAADLDVEQLKRRLGSDVLFSTIEDKLTCSKCRRGKVKLAIHNAPRG